MTKHFIKRGLNNIWKVVSYSTGEIVAEERSLEDARTVFMLEEYPEESEKYVFSQWSV